MKRDDAIWIAAELIYGHILSDLLDFLAGLDPDPMPTIGAYLGDDKWAKVADAAVATYRSSIAGDLGEVS